MTQPKFGLAFPPMAVGEVKELAVMAEDLGFDALGLSDSQSLFREVYVACAAAADVTSSLSIGPRVTNPVTRHPAVTAAAMATLQELSAGRAFLGIGTGDSALLNIGLRPARVKVLEEYVRAVSSLLTTGSADHDGRDITLSWAADPANAISRIPIQIAAEGPKTLRMAGRAADGALVGMGLTPELIEHSLSLLAAGAAEAGRSVADLDIWWMTKANIGADPAVAISEMRMALAASAHHAFRYSLADKLVPERFVDAAHQLQQQYRFSEHESLGRGRHNAELIDRLGLRDYLADRFAIVGQTGDWIRRLESLIAAGARNFWLTVHVQDKRSFVRTVGEQVLPHFRAGS